MGDGVKIGLNTGNSLKLNKPIDKRALPCHVKTVQVLYKTLDVSGHMIKLELVKIFPMYLPKNPF